MASKAQGTVFSFTPKSGVKVTVGLLTSVGAIRADAQEIDVTTLESGGVRRMAQGLKDYGTVELEGFHEKGQAGQSALRAAFGSGAEGQVEIAFPDGTKAAFPAFVKSWSLGSAQVDGVIGFGATLRLTGAVTLTE